MGYREVGKNMRIRVLMRTGSKEKQARKRNG